MRKNKMEYNSDETVLYQLVYFIEDRNITVRKRKKRKANLKENEKIVSVEEYNKNRIVRTICGDNRIEFSTDDNKIFKAWDGKNDVSFYIDYIGRSLVIINGMQIPLSQFFCNLGKTKVPSNYYLASLFYEISKMGLGRFLKDRVEERYKYNKPERNLYFSVYSGEQQREIIIKEEAGYSIYSKDEEMQKKAFEKCGIPSSVNSKTQLVIDLDDKEYVCTKEDNQLYINCDGKRMPISELLPNCTNFSKLAKYISDNPDEFKKRIISGLYGKCIKEDIINGVKYSYHEKALVLNHTQKVGNVTREIEFISETQGGNASYCEAINVEGNPSRRVIRALYDKESKTLVYETGDTKVTFKNVNVNNNRLVAIIEALNNCEGLNINFSAIELIIEQNISEFSFEDNRIVMKGKIDEIDGVFKIEKDSISFESNDSCFEIKGRLDWWHYDICYRKNGEEVRLSTRNSSVLIIAGGGSIIKGEYCERLTDYYKWLYKSAIIAFERKYGMKLGRKKGQNNIEGE